MLDPAVVEVSGERASVRVTVDGVRELRFDSGEPVRAASAIAPFAGGWLVAQDDATHAAHLVDGSVRPVRVLPAVAGHEVFSAADGTKKLKPDFEAACPVSVDGTPGVLLLGSGSSPARMRASLLLAAPAGTRFVAADLAPLYAAVATALELPVDQLNLEGSCLLDGRLRWFQRGNGLAGVASASVDVDLATLLAAVTRGVGARAVAVDNRRRYDLGRINGVGLAVTDAVSLPDGRVLVSAAAEDTPNAVDDGPVVGAALALLDGATVVAVSHLPDDGSGPHKVEGLAVERLTTDGARLLAVVDADDPAAASVALTLRVHWR
ncbi:MAG TPA: hypothetical protein VF755_23345 [Catenuloplanes sp.]|jgi:hypothetical protein